MSTHQPTSKLLIPAMAVFGACALCWLSLLAPTERLWGINIWQELPRLWMALATLVVIIAAILIGRKPKHIATSSASESRFQIWLLALVPILFWIARARTHFLGDGYQLLASLREGAVSQKFWDQGISSVTSGLHSLLSTTAADPALLTYQALSIGAGVLWIAGLWFYARLLHDTTKDRILFVAVLLTGGMSLQFFGYVENYPLFLVFYGLTLLDGLRYLTTGRAPWVTILLALATCLLHLFGLSLIPGLVVLFAYRMWRSQQKGRALPLLTGVIVAGVLISTIALYWYGVTNALWFRFTVAPIVADRFTIESYTMFSPAHLLDMANLLIVLVPGLLCVTPFLIGGRLKACRSDPENAFLVTAALSGLLAVLVMDPKLGMARDWDLFAFAGLPLALLLVRLSLMAKDHTYAAQTILSIAVVINLFFLVPRVTTQALPDPGIERFRYYLSLDHARGRNARRALADYYRSQGDEKTALKEAAALAREFPERELVYGSLAYVAQGNIRKALSMNLEAVELNPIYWDAYWGAGQCYMKLNRPDSAIGLFEIASALNPYNGIIHNSLGNALLRTGQMDRAEVQLVRASEIDRSQYAPYVTLATIYIKQRKLAEADKCLSEMIDRDNTPADAFRIVGDAFLEARQLSPAQNAYDIAIARGLDTTHVQQRLSE